MDPRLDLEELRTQGYTIIPGVLDADHAEEVRRRTWTLADANEDSGIRTRDIPVDPNEHSVRLANLIDADQIFRDLITHPVALDAVNALIDDNFLISNFSANIALPGARSMKVHSDLALVLPEPWIVPLSLNVAWCLSDVSEENGATRVLPGSHLVQRRADLPDAPEEGMVSIRAAKGSVVLIDGRVWHTSGNNTSDVERAMLFGYYSADFLRTQQNWAVTLSQETKDQLDPQLKRWLGLLPQGNERLHKYLYFEKAQAVY